MAGPLTGIKILEFAGIGPGPFAAMMLADLGADILRIDRSDRVSPSADKSKPSPDLLNRGRRSVGLNLKSPEGVETALKLVEQADVVLEGFRPGVMEKLGLGPEVCQARNEKLIFGRMTGWGQSGPMANAAGHDINYIALAGALEPIGRAGEKPLPPLNLVGDFGGGGMLLAYGVLAALVERGVSGKGQVVDAAMVDGAAVLSTMFYSMRNMNMWNGGRGGNLLDTGAHFYEVYETKDGKYISLGAIEPQFYAEFLKRADLVGDDRFKVQMAQPKWPEQKKHMAEVFLTKTRDEWCELLEGTDACFAPVLDPIEATKHPHNVERKTFVEVGGAVQPAPAPRFSRTPGEIQRPAPWPGAHTDEALSDWGFTSDDLASLREKGAIA